MTANTFTTLQGLFKNKYAGTKIPKKFKLDGKGKSFTRLIKGGYLK